MKILITGATGFIGKRLTIQLAQAGHEVFCLVRKQSIEKAKEEFKNCPRVNFITGDLTNNDVLEHVSGAEVLAEQIEAVIHLAANYNLAATKTEAYLHNVVGTQNLLFLVQRMKGLKHFHYMSTYAVSGMTSGEVLEEDLDSNSSFSDQYSQTKMQAELLVRKTKLKSASLRIYRPGIVIGDSKTGKMDKIDGPYYFFRFFHQIAKYASKLPFIYAPIAYAQGATLPFIPVDTLVEWMVRMVSHPTSHKIRTYHLVPEEKIFVASIIEDSAKLFGINLKVKWIPLVGPMKNIFTKIKIPSEVNGHLLNTAKYSTANLKADFPDLKCPKSKNYLPTIISGAKELFQ